MRTTRWILVGCCLAVAALPASAQPPAPKPGPEHEMLKQKFVGAWDVTASFGGMQSKGVATYQMTLGGFWLVEHFTGEFAGVKFEGRGTMGYDPGKKAYTATWTDSMSPSMIVMEGTFDKAGKTFTETGEGMGPDGKKMKMKNVYQFTDKDSFMFTMYDVTGGKDQEMMKLTYKRKK
jgi:Protein of unknown function (DUF1579)